jgi:hypothetical protein
MTMRQRLLGDPQRPGLDLKCYVAADDHGAADVLRRDGLALAKASMLQRASHDLVLIAVQQEGLALQFASEELKANAAVVKTAAAQNPRAWRHAAEELRLSTELLEVAIRDSQQLLSNGNPQLSLEESEPAFDHSFVFVFETGGQQMRARAKMSREKVKRLPLLEAIVDSADRGFRRPQDENGAVAVQIPLCVSPDQLRAFVAGRRASLSDFVLADFFLEPALRHAVIAYLKECQAKSFEASFHNFLTFYPGLVRLLCQFGPELGISKNELQELFCEHCWHRIPVKRLKNFERTVEQIASRLDTVSFPCICSACSCL